MNVVWVVRGWRVEPGVVVDVDVVELIRDWMPRFCAAGVCVRKAKGALELLEGSVLGCNKARSLASCASLRFFSARRAVLSFCVSTSLRRRV